MAGFTDAEMDSVLRKLEECRYGDGDAVVVLSEGEVLALDELRRERAASIAGYDRVTGDPWFTRSGAPMGVTAEELEAQRKSSQFYRKVRAIVDEVFAEKAQR